MTPESRTSAAARARLPIVFGLATGTVLSAVCAAKPDLTFHILGAVATLYLGVRIHWWVRS